MKLKGWNDITLEKFYKIQDFLQDKDDYTFLNILGVIYEEVDFDSMAINDFTKFADALTFLKSDITRAKLKKNYTLNGRVYDSNFDLTSMSVAQFIDYQNYIKKDDRKYEEMLSVFFIPEGHKYNDGYDIGQVQEDLLQLSMPIIMSAAFFFVTQYHEFCILFQHYLTTSLKMMKIEDPKMKEAIQLLEQINLSNLE